MAMVSSEAWFGAIVIGASAGGSTGVFVACECVGWRGVWECWGELGGWGEGCRAEALASVVCKILASASAEGGMCERGSCGLEWAKRGGANGEVDGDSQWGRVAREGEGVGSG